MIMEIVKEEIVVKPVFVRALCPKCGIELKKKNEVLMTYPAQYQYYCEKCDFTSTSTTNYPHICYKDEKGNTI